MTQSNITVNVGDFDDTKASLLAYLKNQNQFLDVDFTGSNISALIDVLAYNTYLNMFYHNMAVNEMFIDTGTNRDSVVSRATELNYTPRSFASATAVVNIAITSTNISRTSLVIPKGTEFIGKVGSNSFVFTTNQAISSTSSVFNGPSVTFNFPNVSLYEGIYLTETYGYTPNTLITIPNQQIDTSSLTVNAVENNGGTLVPYIRTATLLDLNSYSNVFFIQGTANSKYQIQFGDGILGHQPTNQAVIAVQYRISSGELPNGAKSFAAGQSIDNETNITVTTVSPALGGAISETIDSIRFNAPRHFETQQNAVVASDYSNLLRQHYPEIIDVSSFGGEQLTPPQYGKVVLSVIVNNLDLIPLSKRVEYSQFLKNRSLLNITPVFVDPIILYLKVNTTVTYDQSSLYIGENDLKTLILGSISTFASQNIQTFNKTFRYSRLTKTIDNTHPSIISNITSISVERKIQGQEWLNGPVTISFNCQPINITSTSFSYNNRLVSINAIGGNLMLVATDDESIINNVGTVDLTTGQVTFINFRPDNLSVPLSVFAGITNQDIVPVSGTVLKLSSSNTINLKKS